MKYFISVSGQFLLAVYMIQPEMKLIVGVISLRSFWQEWKFISGDKISCKHHPKWNYLKGNIWACVYFIKTKMIGFYWLGHFPGTISETKFYLFLPTMKSNVNRIYFIVGWNFISGRCHFGSQVNTLLVFSVYEGTEQNMGVFAQVKSAWDHSFP